MGLLSCHEMRELERRAFRKGISAESLMDKAGKRLGEALVDLYSGPGTAVAYVGKGNNGGDACLLYTSPSPRDVEESRMPSSA